MLNKEHGKHPEYDMAYIRVEICKTKEGLLTHHYPETEKDEGILMDWGSGGMEQVASALLNEGVKREIYLAILSDVSQKGEIDGQAIEKNVYNAIHKMILMSIKQMTPRLVESFDQNISQNG